MRRSLTRQRSTLAVCALVLASAFTAGSAANARAASPAAPPTCRADQLKVASRPLQESMDNYARAFTVTNSSASACTLDGTPTATFSAGRRTLTMRIVHDGAYLLPKVAPAPVTLAPEREASFSLAGVQAADQACATVRAVTLSLSGAPHRFALGATVPACAGAEVDVSALVAGATGPRFSASNASTSPDAPQLRIAHDSGTGLWGVDECSPATPDEISAVTSKYGKPDFWGRYLLGNKNCAAFTSAEVKNLNTAGIQILLIDGNGPDNESGTDGASRATAAIQAAGSLGAPNGTAVYADIENNDPVSAGWLEDWYKTFAASQYTAGYYGETDADTSNFNTPYCSAVSQIPAMGSQTVMYAYNPILHDPTFKADRPAYAPTGPPCTAQVALWQYAQGVTSDLPYSIDEDESGSVNPDLWGSSTSSSAPMFYALHGDGSVWEHAATSTPCTSTETCTGYINQDHAGSKDSDIAAGNGYLYVLHQDGSVWEKAESTTPCTDASSCPGYVIEDHAGSNDTAIAAGNGYLYVLHQDGSVWEHPATNQACTGSGGCPGFIPLDHPGSGDQAIAVGNGYLYVLHGDHSVWEHPTTSTPCTSGSICTGYIPLDNDKSNDTAIAAGNNFLYVLHADGSLFEHAATSTPCTSSTCLGYVPLDHPGSQDQAIAAGNGYLYVRHADHSVFERPAGTTPCTTSSCPGYIPIDGPNSGDTVIAATP